MSIIVLAARPLSGLEMLDAYRSGAIGDNTAHFELHVIVSFSNLQLTLRLRSTENLATPVSFK